MPRQGTMLTVEDWQVRQVAAWIVAFECEAEVQQAVDHGSRLLMQETRYMRAYLQAASAFVVPRC